MTRDQTRNKSQLIQPILFLYCEGRYARKVYDNLAEQLNYPLVEISLGRSEEFQGLPKIPSHPSLILLYLSNIKRGKAIEILEGMKQRHPLTSILACSSSPTITEAVYAVQSGADDYLAFPADWGRVKRVVQKCLRPVLHKKPFRFQLALEDEVTGLPNSRYFRAALEGAIFRARNQKEGVALIFLDLDRFKHINDTYGHLAGNRVLAEIGDRIRQCMRREDQVFRYGGDEFVVLLAPCDRSTAERVAMRIQQHVSLHPLNGEGHVIRLTVSAGIATFPKDASGVQGLIKAADRAMFEEKATNQQRLSRSIEVQTGLLIE